MHYIDWVEVASETESLTDYVEKLSQQVRHKKPVFAGLSFGGIMAMGLSKIYGSEFAIMLSSFRDKRDLKASLRALLGIKAYQLIPNIEMNAIRTLVRKAYATSSKVSEEKLIEMMGAESPMFLRWACKQIDEYQYDLPADIQLYPIVGTKDRLVNVWKDHEEIRRVRGGSHITVYAQSEEVNNYISEILEQYV